MITINIASLNVFHEFFFKFEVFLKKIILWENPFKFFGIQDTSIVNLLIITPKVIFIKVPTHSIKYIIKHIGVHYIDGDHIKISGRNSYWLTNCDQLCIFSLFIAYQNQWESAKIWPFIFLSSIQDIRPCILRRPCAGLGR